MVTAAKRQDTREEEPGAAEAAGGDCEGGGEEERRVERVMMRLGRGHRVNLGSSPSSLSPPLFVRTPSKEKRK